MKLFIATLVVLVAVATSDRPKSDCEKHREKALEQEPMMALIPKCKENGDYEELQCYKEGKFCVCYNKQGHAVSPPSTKIKFCECHKQRFEKEKYGDNDSYKPQCDADGSFSKMQCWERRKICWCVDEKNEKVGNVFDAGEKTC